MHSESSTTLEHVDESSPYNTACRDCVFASFDDKNIQDGCKLDRLAKFHDQGTQLVPVTQNGKSFFVIKGRICTTCRPGWWGSKRSEADWESDVRQEIALRCEIFVYVSEDNTLEDLRTTVKSLRNQVMSAVGIHAIINNKQVKHGEVVAMLQKELGRRKWKVNFPTEANPTRERCLDLATYKCKGSYYAVFNAGFQVPDTFILDLDRSLNDNLERFSLLLPDENGNGLVVQNILSKKVGGNKEIILEGDDDIAKVDLNNIIEKIEMLAKEQNMPYMIRKVSDICNHM